MQALSEYTSNMAFQFTHPRGVRSSRAGRITRRAGFNSRTREGCDAPQVTAAGGTQVSIHAPARGAICCENPTSGTIEVSIHAPARGAIIPNTKSKIQSRFQFTHPRGVRFGRYLARITTICFNSRTREGCDFAAFEDIDDVNVSIHAPARGAIGL